MSLNKAHASGGGVILYQGERLLIFCNGIDMKVSFNQAPQLSDTSKGSIYLTTHRVVYVAKGASKVQSFSMPLLHMKEVEVKQPIFGANRVEGGVTSEVDGGYSGMANFAATFNKGGAIEFGQALLEAGKRANANRAGFATPPPYSAFDPSQLYQPPPYNYQADTANYGYIPAHEAFAAPPPGFIYMYPAPPPYPGAAPPQPPPFQGQGAPYPSQGAPYPTNGAPPASFPQQQTGYYNHSNPYQASVASAPPPYDQVIQHK